MQSLDPIFDALADGTRLAILARLALGETSVGALSEPFTISAPAISRHLRVLEEAGLISNTRVGKQRLCRLNRPRLALANAWIGELTAATEASFDRLEAYLKTLNPPQESSE
jgi:DNA-binding transcriptional ArsR family regulator